MDRVKYTLAQYLAVVTLTEVTKLDFDTYCGVSTDKPLIGYGDYGPNGPIKTETTIAGGPANDSGFVVIVDGNDIQVINDDVTGGTVFYTATAEWAVVPSGTENAYLLPLLAQYGYVEVGGGDDHYLYQKRGSSVNVLLTDNGFSISDDKVTDGGTTPEDLRRCFESFGVTP